MSIYEKKVKMNICEKHGHTYSDNTFCYYCKYEELEQKLLNHYHGDIGIWYDPEEYKGVRDRIEELKEQFNMLQKQFNHNAIETDKRETERKDKIAKLEQKLQQNTDYINKEYGVLWKDNTIRRIDKLENRAWDTWTHKIEKEISELRNQIQNNSIADLNHYTELSDKVHSIEANILNWQDAWVKVSNSYLTFNDLAKENRKVLEKLEGEKSVDVGRSNGSTPETHRGGCLEERLGAKSADSKPENLFIYSCDNCKKTFEYSDMNFNDKQEYICPYYNSIDIISKESPAEPKFNGKYQCQGCLAEFTSLEMFQNKDGDLVCPRCSGAFIEPFKESKNIYQRLQECEGNNILKEQPEEPTNIVDPRIEEKLWKDAIEIIIRKKIPKYKLVLREELKRWLKIIKNRREIELGMLMYELNVMEIELKKYLGDEKKDG